MKFNTKPYNSAADEYKNIHSERVQKISVDAGFTCPNRDGTKGIGGCTYCNNKTFNPFYCASEKSISRQIAEGIAFFSKKYKTQKYIAYFQAYTNTYAPLTILSKLWNEALRVPDVIGIAVSTRPDCIDKEKLDYLKSLSEKYYVSVEFGVESCFNKTLDIINRGHTFEETKNALKLSAERGLHTVAHIILGLPGETRSEILEQAEILSKLPFNNLKIHQLQIIKETPMHHDYLKNPEKYNLFSSDEYIAFVSEFTTRLRPDIKIERFVSEAPLEMIVAPKWGGLKNFEITAKIEKYMKENGLFQGKSFKI